MILFILGMLFLIVAPIAGCNGCQWGEEHAEWRVRRSSEWKEIKAKSMDFEAELEDIRRKGKAENQKRQETRERELREWETKTRAEYSQENTEIETRIQELRKQLSSLPVVESSPTLPTKPLSDADFQRTFERWANKEQKEDWKKFVKADNSAKKYQSSLADMERKAKQTGGRVEDEPGYAKALKLYHDADTSASQLREKLMSAYIETAMHDTVDQVSRMFKDGGMRKSLSTRIVLLENRVKEQMEETESHLCP